MRLSLKPSTSFKIAYPCCGRDARLSRMSKTGSLNNVVGMMIVCLATCRIVTYRRMECQLWVVGCFEILWLAIIQNHLERSWLLKFSGLGAYWFRITQVERPRAGMRLPKATNLS